MNKTYITLLSILNEEIKTNNVSEYTNILRDIKFRMQIEETMMSAIMCFSKRIDIEYNKTKSILVKEKIDTLYNKVKFIG